MTGKEKHPISSEELLSVSMNRTRYIRLAMIYVRDENDAEDIFHDCVLELIKNRDRIYLYDINAYFPSMVKHRCLRYLQRKSKSEAEDLTGPEVDPILQYYISRLEADEETETIRKADFIRLYQNCKKKLPALTLSVFEAKRLQNMSYKEISANFGITKNKINFEIKKALKVFREEFKDYRIFLIVIIMLTDSII